MKTKKRLIGDFGERMAARFLRRHGYRIVARNYRAGHLELDIVAKNRSEIVFVEVKTRSVVSLDDDMPYGPPSAAVNRAKKAEYGRRGVRLSTREPFKALASHRRHRGLSGKRYGEATQTQPYSRCIRRVKNAA